MSLVQRSLAAALSTVALCLVAPKADAQLMPTVLLSFNGPNGQSPLGSLFADSAGNLYGTTYLGGALQRGTVFELSPPGQHSTTWTETLLASFTGANGRYPRASLIADTAGNFYSTTSAGGSADDGTVFELSPPTGGGTTWTETVLTTFTGANGAAPMAAMAADKQGNLYGTTSQGGANRCSCGTVFEISPPSDGGTSWMQTVLSSFDRTAGVAPSGSLLVESSGKLIGTARTGGELRFGTVFRLAPPAKGKTTWTYSALNSFSGTSGQLPVGNLIADAAGNLYGTTLTGGASGTGTAFELSPPAPGSKAWTETVLVSFNGATGKNPYGSLIMDAAGNLYGTTAQGGAKNMGIVFKLSPPTGGGTAWTETVLTSFNGADGEYPSASLIADADGNLYGTTSAGGADNDGTVFELTGSGFAVR
jgi:uncharacterized repeat protein (TIGR03803 family)